MFACDINYCPRTIEIEIHRILNQQLHIDYDKLQYPDYFLGAFAKLRKATVSFVMSVRLSVRMEQLRFRQTNFHEI